MNYQATDVLTAWTDLPPNSQAVIWKFRVYSLTRDDGIINWTDGFVNRQLLLDTPLARN